MRKDEKVVQSQREDAVLGKVILWFLSAVVLEFLLFLVNRFYINVRVATEWGVPVMNAIHNIVRVLPFVGIIVAALLVIRGVTWKKKGKNAGKFAVAAVLSLVVALCSLIIWRFYDTGVKFLYVFVPVIAVLALIYYLYQREFFLSALICGMGGIGLWAVRKNGLANHAVLMYVSLAIVVVAAVIMCAIAWSARKNKGIWTVNGKSIKLFSVKANYVTLAVSCVLACACYAIGLFLGSTVAYYLLFVLAAWLVVLLVYHTVKLM